MSADSAASEPGDGEPVPAEPMPPTLEFVAHAQIELGEPVELGHVPTGVRRIIPITGGTIAGPRLRADIDNGGADWQIVSPDGTAVIDTRYSATMSDGSTLFLQTRGFRHAAPGVLARLAAGEPVAPSEYYFRLTVELECGSPDHAWVNNTVFVASAQRAADAVTYDLFALR